MKNIFNLADHRIQYDMAIVARYVGDFHEFWTQQDYSDLFSVDWRIWEDPRDPRFRFHPIMKHRSMDFNRLQACIQKSKELFVAVQRAYLFVEWNLYCTDLHQILAPIVRAQKDQLSELWKHVLRSADQELGGWEADRNLTLIPGFWPWPDGNPHSFERFGLLDTPCRNLEGQFAVEPQGFPTEHYVIRINVLQKILEDRDKIRHIRGLVQGWQRELEVQEAQAQQVREAELQELEMRVAAELDAAQRVQRVQRAAEAAEARAAVQRAERMAAEEMAAAAAQRAAEEAGLRAAARRAQLAAEAAERRAALQRA